MDCADGREAWQSTDEAMSVLGWWGSEQRERAGLWQDPWQEGLLGKEFLKTVSREGTQRKTGTLPMSESLRLASLD